MGKFNILIGFLTLICTAQAQVSVSQSPSTTGQDFVSFGETIDVQNAVSEAELSRQYERMAVGDTVRTKFRATVTDVCKVKGCWMKLRLPDNRETMVRFKDYGFFMPKNIVGREVIVNGKAFVEELGVEDQKHYARDGGQTESEIAKITTPKKTYGFEADGVLLSKQ